MKNLIMACVAGLTVAFGGFTVQAAQAPAANKANITLTGSATAIQLPGARSADATNQIVVAQRGGGGPRAGGGGGGPRVGGGGGGGGPRAGRGGGGRPVARGGRRRGKIGTGGKIAIGAAILGAAILAGQAAQADDDRGECRRWRRQCRDGSDRACWKFDNRC